ncbi:MAG: hypothetical protein ACI4PE_05335 [Bacilli bacterium]
MKEKNDNYEKKLMSIINNCDDINIYVDEVNGKYEYKRIGYDATNYKYIDRIETDGIFAEENVNSCFLENANYAIIKTYEGLNVKKISVILSPMLYGMVSSYVLRKGDEQLISTLENSTKGDLNNFELCTDSPSFSICPVGEQVSIVRKLEC